VVERSGRPEDGVALGHGPSVGLVPVMR
jgi:hypothetical protein